MMRLSILFLCFIFLISCARQSQEWKNLKSSECDKYTYGRIDAKRQLTEEDKILLQKGGLRILEFVLENQYLAAWDERWNKKSLDQSPLKALIPFERNEKLASGMQLDQLNTLSASVGQSMVLLQTLAPVDSTEIRQFGKVLFHKDHFYRLVVPNHRLSDIIEYPCLRLISIVKENYEPDKK